MDSREVFQLRNDAKSLSGSDKLNKLSEALDLARRLYDEEGYDEWIQKALAYTLIDFCKFYIAEKKTDQAAIYFRELVSIEFGTADSIIEGQISFLRPKFDHNYSEIQQADEFSKAGNHQGALDIFKRLIAENRLTALHHEAYGWIIYRYCKAEENNLSSLQVKTWLRDYMKLGNERPSLLHSMILNFALHYSKTHDELDFYRFFLLWGKNNIRYEDMEDSSKDGKTIPSLFSRVCAELVKRNAPVNIEEDIITSTTPGGETLLDYFREPFFWMLYNAHRENRLQDLWNLFERYQASYGKYGQSKWHSEILSLAERFMTENDEWRFLHFFKTWNPQRLRSDDWKEVMKDGHTYKPLAIKAIKKAFDVIKKQDVRADLSWLITPYTLAVKHFPDDEWLLREKALLHIKAGDLGSAIELYRQLTLVLGDKYYIWQEFAGCFAANNDLKIAMLSKALSLETNEDFLGDIRMELARLLINENLPANAQYELAAYKKHREIKGWRLSREFEDQHSRLENSPSKVNDNQALYEQYLPLAEDFAFADIEWTELVLLDKWKDDNGKERLSFSDGKSIAMSTGKGRFRVLQAAEPGSIYRFKLHKQEVPAELKTAVSWYGTRTVKEYKYSPLIVEKTDKDHWAILDETVAVVDFINREKDIVHAITHDNKEVFFPQLQSSLEAGDFIRAKRFTRRVKDENRIELRLVHKTADSEALSKFQSQLAVVDGVNAEKQLFHFVINAQLQGIVRYSETDLRPEEGDFIRLRFVYRLDKEKKWRVRVLDLQRTEEINENVRKDVTGILKVSFKNKYGQTHDAEDAEDLGAVPDFAFVGDYYVPKFLLEQQGIRRNCRVIATIVFDGKKWKALSIKKVI